MIQISITGVTFGREPGPIYRDIVASAILEIRDGAKTKTVKLYLHDVPNASARHSQDEAEIRRVAQETIDNPAWRKKIEGWL